MIFQQNSLQRVVFLIETHNVIKFLIKFYIDRRRRPRLPPRRPRRQKRLPRELKKKINIFLQKSMKFHSKSTKSNQFWLLFLKFHYVRPPMPRRQSRPRRLKARCQLLRSTFPKGASNFVFSILTSRCSNITYSVFNHLIN